MKRIVVIKADGTESVLDHVPLMEEMRQIVGGTYDHVRVVDRVENDRPIYTSMFVNDDGSIIGLPRNQKATELYQRNVRLQFPNSANPFKDASDAWRKTLPAGAILIDATPESAKQSGYDEDPFIVGTAIYFEGYTCEEADQAYCDAKAPPMQSTAAKVALSMVADMGKKTPSQGG